MYDKQIAEIIEKYAEVICKIAILRRQDHEIHIELAKCDQKLDQIEDPHPPYSKFKPVLKSLKEIRSVY